MLLRADRRWEQCSCALCVCAPVWGTQSLPSGQIRKNEQQCLRSWERNRDTTGGVSVHLLGLGGREGGIPGSGVYLREQRSYSIL